MKNTTVNYLKKLSEDQAKFSNPFCVPGKLIEKDVPVKEVIKNLRGKLVAVIELDEESKVQIQLRNQLVDPATVKKITIQEFSLEKDLVIDDKLVISMEDERGRHTKPFGL